VSDLSAVNQLKEGQALTGVEALVVPVALSAAPSAHTVLYTARRGDTLVSIADRFGVSLDQLRRWNGISGGTRVTPGQRLHVAEPVAARRTRGSHRTGGGELRAHGARNAKSSAHDAGDPPANKTRGSTRRSGSHHSSASRQSTNAKSSAKKQK